MNAEGGISLKEKILQELVVPEGTFLHLASKLGLQDVVRALLTAGANPVVENRQGENAYEMATSETIQQVYVEELLRAAAKSDIARIDQLIKAGVDPNSWDCDEKKNTVLHWAVSFGNAQTVKYLIGPESPLFPKENSLRTPSVNGHHPNVTPESVEYIPLHPGFNACLEGVIRGLEWKAPIHPIVTDTNLSLLWPQPKSLHQLEGLHFRPEKILHLSVIKSAESVHRILDIFSTHKDVFETLGFDVTAQQVENSISHDSNQSSCILSSQIQCCVNPDILSLPNSYRLHITSQKVRITAADLCGLNYAISTFLQLLTIYSKEEPAGIPPLIINDSPSLKHRAVFIDVTQERIPTIESLFEIIKTLGLLKINYLHLHMRLDKNGPPLSYTKGEIVAIDRNCQDACITLVPAIDIPFGISATEYFQFIKPCYMEFLPVSEVDSIVMMCFNALKTHITNPSILNTVPTNVVLVEYGFQADYHFGALF
ncbi:Beta-hexosaminidase [Orchesella cincta]|uniref:Beta-hexosaminidase n=1 Tax=Orchesella cincta TaxID=48709 RepID=A0A1D2MW16_ORCCI|nr:Beta-hexosaminidase [Orchesella cincta]